MCTYAETYRTEWCPFNGRIAKSVQELLMRPASLGLRLGQACQRYHQDQYEFGANFEETLSCEGRNLIDTVQPHLGSKGSPDFLPERGPGL
jgi:hypothetical protein